MRITFSRKGVDSAAGRCASARMRYGNLAEFWRPLARAAALPIRPARWRGAFGQVSTDMRNWLHLLFASAA